jgi:hypothetical protein
MFVSAAGPFRLAGAPAELPSAIVVAAARIDPVGRIDREPREGPRETPAHDWSAQKILDWILTQTNYAARLVLCNN